MPGRTRHIKVVSGRENCVCLEYLDHSRGAPTVDVGFASPVLSQGSAKSVSSSEGLDVDVFKDFGDITAGNT